MSAPVFAFICVHSRFNCIETAKTDEECGLSGRVHAWGGFPRVHDTILHAVAFSGFSAKDNLASYLESVPKPPNFGPSSETLSTALSILARFDEDSDKGSDKDWSSLAPWDGL